MTEDLTPKFPIIPAAEEVTQPTLPSDAGVSSSGGMMTSGQSLTTPGGLFSINGVLEQILIGSATAPLTGIGIFIGNTQSGGSAYDFRAGDPSGNYIHWDANAATLTVVGSISVTAGGTIGGFDVGSDYIRDVANTFGLASTVTGGDDVRFWAGAAFASRSTAPLRMTESGAAHFENVVIGGNAIQYVITNSGIFSYGDGSDGAATFDGSATPAGTTKSGSDYTLTRDVYYTDATFSTGTTLNTNGYRLFGTGTLTLNGTAVIKRNGNAGTDGGIGGNNGGTVGTAGTGGGALADGYLKGAVAGQDGTAGGGGSTSTPSSSNNASNGTATTNSLGSVASNGVRGGTGGAGSAGSGASSGTAGTAGTCTASNVKLIANWHLATLLDIGSTGSTVKFDNSSGVGGSSGGGGGNGDGVSAAGGSGGGGGGGGTAAGIVAIYFRVIVIGASASITAIGGNGGKGGNGGDGGSGGGGSHITGGGGGGGGGSAGNGGIVVLTYNTLTNSGSISVAGGTHGAKGLGGAHGSGGGTNGSDGTDGNDGSAGNIYYFQLSL